MTNHQPVDARPSAWIGAHERIAAAQKLKLEPGSNNRVADPLPELYWATLAEAAVLADLARAPGAVGYLAGAHLAGRAERIAENTRQMEELLRRAEGRRKPTRPPMPGRPTMPEYREQFAGTVERGRPHPNTAPFAVGHHVRVTEGDWAGRTGTVAATYLDNQPPVVDVTLNQSHPGADTPTITVLPGQLDMDVTKLPLKHQTVGTHDHAIGAE